MLKYLSLVLKWINEVRICFNYSFPYYFMAYFTAVQLLPWKGVFVHLLKMFPAKLFSTLSSQYFILWHTHSVIISKTGKRFHNLHRFFCKYDCKPKCSLCFKQVAIPFVLVSCAFEAVQVTTQLSSKRYITFCISALVRVSNLFWKNSEFSNLNVNLKKIPIRSHCCFYLLLGLGVLFSHFCKLRSFFLSDKWV